MLVKLLHTPFDAGDTVRDRDACQAGASSEGMTLDAGDSIGDRDAG